MVLLLALAAAYFLWFRTSSFVAVNDVEVVGLTGPGREEVADELTRVAEGMSTLAADAGAIEDAARRFPIVAGVEVDPNFPHGMRIEVAPRRPVLFAPAGEALVAVAGDGVILRGFEVSEGLRLPIAPIEDPVPAGAARLEGDALDYARLLGAAPGPLLPLVRDLGESKDYGIELTLRGGIEVRFGPAEEASEKWTAAAAVLADRKLKSAAYVDVRVPTRPAVG